MKKTPPEDSLFPPPTARQSEAAASLASMVEQKMNAKRRPPRASRDQIGRAREQMNAMAASGEWGEASGTHLVALYEWLHEQVYGVATAELDPKTWTLAAQAAGRMAEQQFDGDYGRAVVFMRWWAKREMEREKWRRENNRPGGRVGWRLMWHGTLVTDYKVDHARRSSSR